MSGVVNLVVNLYTDEMSVISPLPQGVQIYN